LGLTGRLRETPSSYFKKYGLEPKKYPLGGKEYAVQWSEMAKDRGLGIKGGREKAGRGN
jgi:predicted transcriptional regulator